MRRLVIGTAGHIDHGKSALVRALTGIEPDRLKEEQARGITIDLGFAHTRDRRRPGRVRRRARPRALRRATCWPARPASTPVLLVVAADESVMPQTREHLDICRLLGVPAGVIALTKTDVADADLARGRARSRCASSSPGRSSRARRSSRCRRGPARGSRRCAPRWQRSPVALTPRLADGPVRLPIDRVFTLRGFGTVVTGTLVSGTLPADDAWRCCRRPTRRGCAGCTCTAPRCGRRAPGSASRSTSATCRSTTSRAAIRWPRRAVPRADAPRRRAARRPAVVACRCGTARASASTRVRAR